MVKLPLGRSPIIWSAWQEESGVTQKVALPDLLAGPLETGTEGKATCPF